LKEMIDVSGGSELKIMVAMQWDYEGNVKL
jgi:hypothetical protein